MPLRFPWTLCLNGCTPCFERFEPRLSLSRCGCRPLEPTAEPGTGMSVVPACLHLKTLAALGDSKLMFDAEVADEVPNGK